MQQRLDTGRCEILIRFRIVLRQMAGESDKFRIHLIEGNAWFEPAHHRRCGIVGSECEFVARPGRELII